VKVNLAHLRERAAAGGWINFAVFEARSASGGDADNARLLTQMTARARASRLQVDQAALAFMASGQLRFFGSKPLVEFLSNAGLPAWTHQLDF
jgi:hypothetical protein